MTTFGPDPKNGSYYESGMEKKDAFLMSIIMLIGIAAWGAFIVWIFS